MGFKNQLKTMGAPPCDPSIIIANDTLQTFGVALVKLMCKTNIWELNICPKPCLLTATWG